MVCGQIHSFKCVRLVAALLHQSSVPTKFHSIVLFEAARPIQRKQKIVQEDKKISAEKHDKNTENTKHKSRYCSTNACVVLR